MYTILNQNSELLTRLHEVREYGDLNGETAKKNDNLHRLFLYPAMMVPMTQSLIIEAISEYIPVNSVAIDPYMGSGTSLLCCMEYGIGVYGQDINPLAVLIAKAKTSFYDIDSIKKSYQGLISRIKEDKSSDIEVNFVGIDKWFIKQVQIDLSKIRRAIRSENNQEIRYLYWVVMSEVIRLNSNDRTSTYKLHQRPKEDILKRNLDVISNFCTLFERSISDLELFQKKLQNKKLIKDGDYSKYHHVCWGNTLNKIYSEQKFDILVSSPPYGDNHTTVSYGQHSFLELQWIDSIDIDGGVDYNYLHSTQEIDRRSLGGRIDTTIIKENLSGIMDRVPSLKEFYEIIKEDEKHVFNKTISFVMDFEKSLDIIVKSMKEDALYVWTIGNRNVCKREVPNDKILVDLMSNKGIELIFDAEREILNKKQPKRNKSSKTMVKEKILIFRRYKK